MIVEPILGGLAPVKGSGGGRPRRRPVKLHADKAYDDRRVRHYLRRYGIAARIVRIRGGPRRTARPVSLGRGTHHRLVSGLPPPGHPLRPQGHQPADPTHVSCTL